MANYAWATDVHLDFLGTDTNRLIKFGEGLVKDNPVGVFLTGDISIAPQLVYHLSALERVVQRPVYFVLGNHDFYAGSFEAVRKAMRELSNASGFLRYMPTMPYYQLSPTTAVVGHDGFWDGLHGDWQNSSFQMTDWNAIQEFKQCVGARPSIIAEARKQAHEGTLHVHNGIKRAVKYVSRIIVLTHVPPFPQQGIREGRLADNNALPFYTSKYMGDMLLDASKSFPNVQFTVLAGHTHGKSDTKIAPNLSVHVGGAEYGSPKLQGLIDVL